MRDKCGEMWEGWIEMETYEWGYQKVTDSSLKDRTFRISLEVLLHLWLCMRDFAPGVISSTWGTEILSNK